MKTKSWSRQHLVRFNQFICTQIPSVYIDTKITYLSKTHYKISTPPNRTTTNLNKEIKDEKTKFRKGASKCACFFRKQLR